jgi:hypothetical protein
MKKSSICVILIVFQIIFCVQHLFSQINEKTICDTLFERDKKIELGEIPLLLEYESQPVPIMGYEKMNKYLTICDTIYKFRIKVFVEFAIDRDGEVICSHIIKSDNPFYNELAKNHVQKIKFKPAIKNGEPTIQSMKVSVNFCPCETAYKRKKHK